MKCAHRQGGQRFVWVWEAVGNVRVCGGGGKVSVRGGAFDLGKVSGLGVGMARVRRHLGTQLCNLGLG